MCLWVGLFWGFVFSQLFRLLSGKQQNTRSRPNLTLPEAGGHQGSGGHFATGSSRRSSGLSHDDRQVGPSFDVHALSGTSGERGTYELRRVSLGPLISVTEGVPTSGASAAAAKKCKPGLGIGSAADAFASGAGAASSESPAEENLPRVRTSFSLASSESYFEVRIYTLRDGRPTDDNSNRIIQSVLTFDTVSRL